MQGLLVKGLGGSLGVAIALGPSQPGIAVPGTRGITLLSERPLSERPLSEQPFVLEPVQPGQKLQELTFFQGRWTCSLQPANAPKAEWVQVQWNIDLDLNGFWLIGQSQDASRQSVSREWMGYNAISKKFGRTVVTNFGAMVNLSTAGWQGNQLLWEGSGIFQTERVAIRQLVTKKGDREFEATYSVVQQDEKTLQPWLKEVCKK